MQEQDKRPQGGQSDSAEAKQSSVTTNNPSSASEPKADTKPNLAPNEPNKQPQSSEKKPGRSWQSWLLIIAIGIIIIVLALPGKNPENSSDTDSETTTSQTDSEDEAMTDAPTNGPGNAIQTMKPVDAGEFTYKFQGIAWELEPEGNNTKVNFRFDRFSRRDTNYVSFGRPYKLGTYKGTCSEKTQLAYDTTVEQDIPLAFVSCRTTDNYGRDIAIFQDIDDNALIVVKSREVTPTSTGKFFGFFDRDITTIVK